MIVEPVPTSSRSPLRRLAGWVGLALPAMLLVVVVAGGLLGRDAGAGAPDATPDATSDATSDGEARGAATPAPPSPPSPSATPRADAWPSVVADLGVRTVGEALERRPRLAPERPIAVAGYLGLAADAGRCPGAATLCERRGILVDRPWVTSGGGVFLPFGIHVHPRFPAAVQLPDAIAAAPAGAMGSPVPVVLVGRFEPGGDPCDPVRASCEVGLLVDRVAWADGAAIASTPVIDPGLDGSPVEWMQQRREAAEVAAVGWSGTVLVSALLRPATVARVDPEAARALATVPPSGGLVWYVRGLETEYDPTRYPLGQSPPRLRWIVLDDVTGEVIADGLTATSVP